MNPGVQPSRFPEFDALLARSPGDYRSLCLLGLKKQQASELAEARACYEAALAVAPPSAELFHNLGVVCRGLGDLPQARSCLEQASELNGGALATLDELALVLQESGDVPGALACYERCLQLDPRHCRAFTGMGMAFADAGWEDDAIRSFETALAIDPNRLEAVNGLGVLYKRQGRYELAIEQFERALTISPDDPGLKRNMALVLGALGRFAEEEAIYRQIIAADGDDADAHFNLACVLLLTGRLGEGWQEYEWRYASRENGESIKPPKTGLSRWSGEPVDKNDSGLIIYAEQGFGDSIQFSRFVGMAAARFGRVRLQTRPPLLTLFRRSFGAYCEVVSEVPDEADYSAHCPLMSLPLAFGTTLDTIPADIPYLLPDGVKSGGWKLRLADEYRPKVGLAWATGKRGMHKRSFELDPSQLQPLFANTGICWVSLNKEPLSPESRATLQRLKITDWTAELKDFDDTAALISALDLVISVDTATAHLAGALGKPVWLLNRAESEWRWLVGRSDSPWYPTMRIFRQRRSRQWTPVIEEVASAIAQLIEDKA